MTTHYPYYHSNPIYDKTSETDPINVVFDNVIFVLTKRLFR